MKKMMNNLLAKFEFWRAKRIKLDEHYTFFFNEADHNSVAIKILKKFPDVIIEFSNIQMQEGSMMTFDFNVIANPNLCNVESDKFKRFTSDIFRGIIIASIENAKGLHENGKSDLVEPVEERELHEEVSSIFEERVPERKPRKKTVRRNKAIRSKVQ
jgi:hypothetical protein